MTNTRLKIGLVVAGFVMLFLIVSLVQEMNRRYQVQREVQALEAEVKTAERKTVELEHLNQYFRTDAFQERLARENLNYSAPGEKVVLVPEEAQDVKTVSNEVPNKEANPSTPLKWWQIFFVTEHPFGTLNHDLQN